MSEFRKSRPDATRADFEMEAAGLRWIGEADGIRVPEVLGVGGDPGWLALERIPAGRLSAEGAEELGRALAGMHRLGAADHGALPPGAPDSVLRIGLCHIELSAGTDWPSLYAGRMLEPVARRARDSGRLSAGDASAVRAVGERIAALAGPEEPPARLHGDLWSGNVLAGPDGRAWLIDPAAYGGHREMDLAMLRLFGAPSEAIFAAYEETAPLAAGHAERIALWHLLPLLVHA
ncbi:MAG: fructosamine kinase family protein, partial [Actinomycetota bacterium]|nr:fructosamine kinase family protein [Actinomycetota bacterium]